ncbi:NAD(P)H-dependent oxidoreductase [Nocardioides limicola]|uniref:NAD(P)H-dependent oxidoreductase n=1 Tax=Nocardioides limicola TaxID=2803368 RepID=UPI00193AFB8B|nr:NAD(P)H-dependent oxidoreductase [Nocardioides sp. DJM-14]
MSNARLVVLVGSLRTGSINRRLADGIVAEAPDGVDVHVASDLEQLPFYNEDLDGTGVPASAAELRSLVAEADGIVVVTPEYNGTMPAVINNAIDWISRPYGAGAIVAKPLAAVGTTPTPYGGKWAHEHTRHSARIAGAAVLDDVLLSEPHGSEETLADPAFRSRVREVIDAVVSAASVAA